MKSLYVVCIVIAIVLAILLLICLILYCKKKWACRKVNCLCFDEKVYRLNEALGSFGFRYQRQGDLIVSEMYCWQREMGYCRKYDEYAPAMNMIFDCEPVYFDYNGHRWLLEFWKGQYGITTGAEIGLYINRKAGSEIPPEKLFYECANDEECIHMQFRLSKCGRILMQRWRQHWWLTGFNVGEYSKKEDLVMEAMVGFPNEEMRNAFYYGLLRAGYRSSEIYVEENRVCFRFDRPRTKQPKRYCKCYLRHICNRNRRNCRRYMRFTKCFICTLDKTNFIGYCFPHLYRLLMHIGKWCRHRKLRKCGRKQSKEYM